MILLSPKDAYPLKAVAKYLCMNIRPSKEAEEMISTLLLGIAESYFNTGFNSGYKTYKLGPEFNERKLFCRKTGQEVQRLNYLQDGKRFLKWSYCYSCDEVHSTQQVKEIVHGSSPQDQC